MMKSILIGAIALVIGLIIGFLTGRFTMERTWSQPYSQVTPSTVEKTAGHNPSPQAGTKVLKPMPIAKSREVLKSLAEKDPVFSNVAAVGANESGVELHVTVENRGACTVTALSGVAYGFDAAGRPAPLLKGGENYVAFESKAPLEPGKKMIVAEELKDVADATLALAHVDHTTCADGTSWTRQ